MASRRQYLRNNCTVPRGSNGRLIRLTRGKCRSQLIWRGSENCTSILRSNVISLGIESGRIVHCPKFLQQSIIRELIAVVRNADHFSMSGKTRTDLLVVRIRLCSAHIPNRCIANPSQLPETPLGPPETPCGKIRALHHPSIISSLTRKHHSLIASPPAAEPPGLSPRSSGDRASPSEGGCAGSNPAGGTIRGSPFMQKAGKSEIDHSSSGNLLPNLLVYVVNSRENCSPWNMRSV
jgi:hypothetical protein